MSILVDTGVILAALIKRERRHHWARRLLRSILMGSYGVPYVTDYIVDEALSYAAARLGVGPAEKLLDLLLRRNVFRIIPVTLDIFNTAARIYEENLPKLSFTDATTVAVARVYGVDYIATLDEELARHYPSITPEGGGGPSSS